MNTLGLLGHHGSSHPDLMTFGNQSGSLKIHSCTFMHGGVSKWTIGKTVFTSFQRSGHSLGFTSLRGKKKPIIMLHDFCTNPA